MITSTNDFPVEVIRRNAHGEIHLVVRPNSVAIVMKNGKRLTSKPLTPGHYTLNSNRPQFALRAFEIWLGEDYVDIVVIFIKTTVISTSQFKATVTNENRFSPLVVNEEIQCSFAYSIEDTDKVIKVFINNYGSYNTVMTDIENLVIPLLKATVSDAIISNPNATRQEVSSYVTNTVNLSSYGLKLEQFTLDQRNINTIDRKIINATRSPNPLIGMNILNSGNGVNNGNASHSNFNASDLIAIKLFENMFNQPTTASVPPSQSLTNDFSFLYEKKKCPVCDAPLAGNAHLKCSNPNCKFNVEV